MMRKICMVLCLFSAFLIVLAHTIIPHHHQELQHDHDYENEHHHHHPTHNHATNHPGENDFDHDRVFSWFINAQKKIESQNVIFHDSDINQPGLILINPLLTNYTHQPYFKKIEYSPPEIIGEVLYMPTLTCGLRAPPYFLS